MLAEGVRKIAGVADSDADLDLEQLERDITRKLKLLPDLRVCDQVFAVQLKIQEFLHDCKLSAVYVPNGWWAKGPGSIMASVIVAGLKPSGYRDDVRRRVHFEVVSSDPYRGKRGRQSTNIRMVLAPRGEVVGNSRVGTGVAHPRERRHMVRAPLGGLL